MQGGSASRRWNRRRAAASAVWAAAPACLTRATAVFPAGLSTIRSESPDADVGVKASEEPSAGVREQLSSRHREVVCQHTSPAATLNSSSASSRRGGLSRWAWRY